MVTNPLRDRLFHAAQDVLSASPAPGASAALFLDGQLAWAAGIGFRDLGRAVPLPADARFPIYSATKSLIAASVLRLVEQGRLDLNAPFQAYLPRIAFETPITLRQLLNHTGGVPDYGALPAYFDRLKADPTHPWTDDEFLSATLFRGLLFPPGRGWQYSNPGYLLLRLVIETVLEQPLRAALPALIFEPLHIPHARVAQTLEDMARLTPGYSAFFSPQAGADRPVSTQAGADRSLQDVRPRYHPGWVSHGLVLATAAELAQALDGILAGPLLRPETRAQMLQPVLLDIAHPLFRQPAYGLGLMIDAQSPYGVMAGHGGGGPGYSAGVLHLPDLNGRRVTAAALANCDQGELGLTIAYQLIAAVADTAW